MNYRHAIDTYRGHTIPHFRLIELRNRWFAFSGVLIALSLLGLVARGLNFSIDFEGGSQVTYTLNKPVTVPAITTLMTGLGRADSQVQIVNGNEVQVRTGAFSNTEETDKVAQALADQTGINRADVNTTSFSATWGSEISSKALKGLILVLLAIGLYIAVRFEFQMAIGAMIALVHDIIITIGVYALVGREVTPATVIAVLTILGFSLYDTVVIYDKIQENTESSAQLARLGYVGVVDRSLNQVLMRSVNTSLVVLLPILSLLLFGGATLKDFAFAMFVGVAIGAYSSIFIAAPILTLIKIREPKIRQMEERRLRRASVGDPADAEPAAVASAVATVSTSDQAAQRVTARTGSGSGGNRPKSKRKPPAKKRRR
ncbi:MAG: preprotein translocase subunit SecF [Actinomycetota bacterium]|jgi:preprotein translocase subunit SecF|nr:preprotein translocase subunit SecF [Actinomycetota bacterium]